MVEKASNNKSTNSNGEVKEKKAGLFSKITKQLDRDMKNGQKEEIAGLKKSANNKKAETPKLEGSKKETKQLPAATQETKQLPAAKTSTKKTAAKKTSIKSKKTVTYSGVADDGRPAWVKAMDNTKKEEAKVEATPDTSFAGNYLMPTPSNSRRKPGPSLNMFKDLARQVKIPASARKG